MDIKEAYNVWADRYDTDENKTRDLEAASLKATLNTLKFNSCLEIGCGTGKNTGWLLTKVERLLAVDFSDEMLRKARAKITSNKVQFIQADICNEWNFAGNDTFDLVTFSLVLEHIRDLDPIFEKLKQVVADQGYVYIGELHPFKQYKGSKARFETENGVQILTCFTHHSSDFILAAKNHGFRAIEFNEYFDDNDRSGIPRILSLLFKKEGAL